MSNLDGNKPGTKNITGDVNVQVAPTPNITVGNTTTLEPGQNATVELDSSSTALNPKFNFGIPKGEQGLQGIQGIPGVPGVDGYTPQKGEDYWTDAEKKEIVDETTEKVLTDATNKFNVNYESKVNEFNENGDNKILEFNNNADEKTTSYNQNATNKTTEFNNNVNSIKDDIEDLKSNQIKGTSSGTNITLNDSANMKMASLVVDGKSTQETRSGKNLFNPNYFEFRTTNGITATLEDDHILLNGTATASAYINFLIPNSLGNNELLYWYIKSDVELNNFQIQRTDQSPVNIKPTTNWTVQGIGNSEDYSYGGYLYIASGVTLTNCKVYIYLNPEYVEVNKLEYEAFGVMPSPDYPSEIEVIEDSIDVISLTKNFFNKDKYKLNKDATWTPTEKGGYFSNKVAWNGVSFQCKLIPNVKYNFSSKKLSSDTIYLYISSYTDDTYETKKTTYAKDVGITSFTFIPDSPYVTITFNTSSILTDVLIDEIQLELGDKRTSFEQHQENAIELILPEPICSLPNGVKDEIYIKDGKAYLKKNVGKFVLNGSESWLKQNTNHDNFVFKYANDKFVPNGSFLSTTIPNIISNKFNKDTWYNAYVNNYPNEGICTHNSNNQLMIIISKDRLADISSDETTLSSFKTWLSENNVTVYYELAEPYEIDLGEVTMPKTYKNVSNIMNSKDTNMNAEYYKDLETVINNLTSAVVALGATE